MMRRTRAVACTATVIALALGATACGGSSGGKAEKGGTLTILNKEDYGHLDPQRVYTTEGSTMDEELVRTLTGWDETGPKPKLVGDLATDTGVPSDNNTVWTFHLRPGIKWQDGTPVTAQDVKYGVERAFSPDINGGPPYASEFLADSSSYQGPFQGKSLDSIQTPDSSTIVFHLSQPRADFNETTAMTGWSAVPKAHDTGASYDLHLWSDGPYMIKSYTHNKELVLVRNPYWSQKTDPLRQQNVNEIDVQFGKNESTIDNLLRSDSGEAQTAVNQWQIAGSDLAGINDDKALQSRYLKIKSEGISYVALNVNRIKDIKVREAIEYAMDKATVRGAFGGEAYGDYATTMLNPGADGYLKFDEYPAPPTGDLTKAKTLMKQAGNPKLTLSVTVENTTTMENVGDAIKNSLARIGITVNVVPVDASNYFNTLNNTHNQYDMAWMDWFPDWPNASTVLPTLFDGRLIKKLPLSNQDVSYLNDPAINARITAIGKMTDVSAQNAAWGQLDKMIMEQASVVPLAYMNVSYLSGSRVGGLIADPILGEPSLVHVFIKS